MWLKLKSSAWLLLVLSIKGCCWFNWKAWIRHPLDFPGICIHTLSIETDSFLTFSTLFYSFVLSYESTFSSLTLGKSNDFVLRPQLLFSFPATLSSFFSIPHDPIILERPRCASEGEIILEFDKRWWKLDLFLDLPETDEWLKLEVKINISGGKVHFNSSLRSGGKRLSLFSVSDTWTFCHFMLYDKNVMKGGLVFTSQVVATIKCNRVGIPT